MLLDKEQKIARPRQIYIGPAERPYKSALSAGSAGKVTKQKDALRQ
jgi:hypothetical protein